MKNPTLALVRVSAGRYTTRTGRYTVEQTGTSWRWLDTNHGHTGGEWRATKREATLDLADYLQCYHPDALAR